MTRIPSSAPPPLTALPTVSSHPVGSTTPALIPDAMDPESSPRVPAPSTPAAAPTPLPGPEPSLREQERRALLRFQANMPQHNQGLNNSCGTTSAAMALAYLGVPGDFRVLDRTSRFAPGLDFGTGPDEIVRFARRAGVRAEQYSDASLDVISAHLRADRPVTVLVNWHPPGLPDQGSGMAHYVNVIGFKRDATGEITGVIIQNPHGSEEVLPRAQFEDMWTDVRLTDRAVGVGVLGVAVPTYNRTMVVYDRAENPPLPGAGVFDALEMSATNTFMTGISGLSHAGQNIGRGDVAHVAAGTAQMLGATVNTVVGGAAMLVGNIIGSNVETGGDALLEAAQDLWDDGNLGAKVGGGFLFALGAIIKALGWILKMLGGVVGTLGNAMGKTLRLPAEALNRRDETREMILNRRPSMGVEDPHVVLRRASAVQKTRLLDNLFNTVGDTGLDDQRAANVILESIVDDPGLTVETKQLQLQQVFDHFGGVSGFLARFSPEERKGARMLLARGGMALPEEPPLGTVETADGDLDATLLPVS